MAKAGGRESALGPAVADAGEVPVDGVRASVAIELCSHVRQLMHRRDVDVVDSAEVED